MSSHKYVCFECKSAVKRDPNVNAKVLCPSCGAECIYIGVKIPIPPKSKPKLWEDLRQQLQDERANSIASKYTKSLARKHELEKELQKLECLAPNSGRLSLIKKLRKEIERYNT